MYIISLKVYFVCFSLYSGPEDTPYSKGTFRATLSFPSTYPMNPPKMKFTTPVFHPNGIFLNIYARFVLTFLNFFFISFFF